MLNIFAEWFLIILKRNLAVSVVILIVLAVRHLLKKYQKKYAYVLWLLVAVRMVFDISLPTVSSVPAIADKVSVVQKLEERTGWDKAQMTEERLVSFANGSSTGMQQNEAVPDVTSHAATAAYTLQERVQGILFLVWIAGMLVMAAVLFFSWMRLKKQVRQAVLLRENIYECDNIPSPFVLGIVKTKIYLPFGLNGTEQGYILAHERFHIKNFDQLARLFATILLMLYWINPLAWVAYICFVRDQEMRCDEAVLSTYGNQIKKEYSSLLLAFAANDRKLMAVPLAFGESDTGKRIKNILDFQNVKKITSAGIVFVLLIVVIVTVYITGNNTQNGNMGANQQTGDDNGLSSTRTEKEERDTEESNAAEFSMEGITGIFAEALSDRELSLEELVTMVEDSDWENFLDTHDINYWKQFQNLKIAEFAESAAAELTTQELQGYYSYNGKKYELTILYWPAETASEYGETADSVDDIFLTETETGDAIGLYHADKRYHADTDIRSYLDAVYDLAAELEMDQVVVEKASHSTAVKIGDYGADVLFDGFYGNLFEFDGYEPNAHSDSCVPSWYSAGGIAEWRVEKGEEFVYDGERLTEVGLYGNHMERNFLESLENDDFYGLLYEYDFETFTASESEEAGIKNYEDTLSKYWVAFLSSGKDEPVYMLFFNQNYFTKDEALMYARSVKKK